MDPIPYGLYNLFLDIHAENFAEKAKRQLIILSRRASEFQTRDYLNSGKPRPSEQL